MVDQTALFGLGTATMGALAAWFAQRSKKTGEQVLEQTLPISNGFAKKVTGSQEQLHEDIGAVRATIEELHDLVQSIAQEQQLIKVKVAVVETEVQGVKRTADSLGTRFDQHMDRRAS